MISLSRTATATFLVLGCLTACASPAVTPGNSVPVPPSGAASPVAPAPNTPPGSPEASARDRITPSKPAGIPKTPTDDIPSPGWTEGTVTRGGTGPCYGLITFDGVAYAMYSDAGTALTKGDHIRAELTPARLRIDCGAGVPVQLGAIQKFP